MGHYRIFDVKPLFGIFVLYRLRLSNLGTYETALIDRDRCRDADIGRRLSIGCVGSELATCSAEIIGIGSVDIGLHRRQPLCTSDGNVEAGGAGLGRDGSKGTIVLERDVDGLIGIGR